MLRKKGIIWVLDLEALRQVKEVLAKSVKRKQIFVCMDSEKVARIATGAR